MTPSPAAEYLSEFGQFLESQSVDIRTLTADEETRVVSLTYASEVRDTDRLSREIGTISGGFFHEVAAGWRVDRLTSTVVTADGSGGDATPVARWHAETAWFDAYDRGDISADELSLRVLQTVEMV